MKLNVPIRQRLKVMGLIFLLGMSCGVLRAQNPLVKQWDKRFGGTGYEQLFSFQQTNDGGYILGGTADSDSSGDKTQPVWGMWNEKDYWIIKINSFGIKLWDKDYGGFGTDWFEKVQQTSDGGYILGGTSTSNSGGDKSDSLWGGNNYDFWIVKVDSLGNKQWDKDYGGFGTENFSSLQQTKDGGYILGGSSTSFAGGDKSQGLQGYGDYWVIKIDSLGNKQWDKDFGGALYDDLYTIVQTTDGGYLLGGYSMSDSSGDKTQNVWGYSDYWIVKIDSLGNKIWDKDFGGTSDDRLFSIIVTPDGGFILGGHSGSGISGNKTSSTWGSWDYWIVKIDSVGNKLWDKDFGTADYDYFYSVENTNDGGYIINGTTDEYFISGDKSENSLGLRQMWAVKTDSLGNKQWDKTIFTDNQGGHGLALQSNDGGYIFADWEQSNVGGYKTQPNWAGNSDYWIVKFYDSTSTFIPSVNVMSSDTSFCEKHCIDFYDLSTNNPTSWQWFFPGSDSLTSTEQNPTNICYSNYGSFDVTLIACNAAGCDTLVLPGFINEYQTLTPTITQSNDTLFSSPGVSYQWWSVDSGIIAGANNSYYIPTQGGSYYVIVTDTTGCEGASNTIIITGIAPLSLGDGLGVRIVPNPNNGTFTITLPSTITKDFSIRITNPLGQTIFNKQGAIGNKQNVIDVNMESAANGLYMVEVINGDKVYRGKVMVQ